MIERAWAMPSRHTFKIKPIAELLERYRPKELYSVDCFAGFNSPAQVTNDLNPEAPTQYHKEALEFVNENLADNTVGLFIFDPPYSPRQISECYKGIGLKPKTDQSFYSEVKDAAAKKISVGGHVICCGWNSNGFGKKRGFELVEMLVVAHGAGHNDTIVTVEKRSR